MYPTQSSSGVGEPLAAVVVGGFPKANAWGSEAGLDLRSQADAGMAGQLGDSPARSRVSLMFLAPFVIAVPLLAVALASTGVAAALGAALVATWVALTIGGLHAPRAMRWLHLAGGLFVVLTLALLPFNSLAFVFDFWAAVVMFVSSASRQKLAL